MELALYCLSRALESFALCLVDWGLVRRRDVPKRIDVLMFSAAVAAIMHCYSDGRGRHRDVFRSKYLNVLDFVFGNTGTPQGPSASLCERCKHSARPDLHGLADFLQLHLWMHCTSLVCCRHQVKQAWRLL